MRHWEDLAQFGLAGHADQAEALEAAALQSCLRFLEREANAAGLPITAHLIAAAALALLEESLDGTGRLAN